MHFKTAQKLCVFLSVLGVGAGSLIVTGCGGGSTTEGRNFAQNVEANKYGVVATELQENNGFVHINGSKQFQLIGIDKQGSEVNLTNTTNWSLSDSSLGTISKSGLFTPAGVAGNLTLTAEFAGQSHTQTVTISDADLVGVNITNTTNVVDVCKNFTTTADALFNNGLVLDYPLTWRLSGSSSIASFPTSNEGNLATFQSGTVSVVAEGKNNVGATISSAPFAVTIADTLSTISLTSSTETTSAGLTLREGATSDIRVNAGYTDNTTANITANASLEVSGNAASIDNQTGKLTANTGSYDGTEVTLTARCNNREAQLLVTVVKPDINSIEIRTANGDADRVAVRRGNSTDLRVTATFEDSAGSDNDYTYNLDWDIDESRSDNFDSNLITLDDNGRLTASNDLNLLQSLGLIIEVRVLDENGEVMVNRIGEELVDTIIATITN